jgi:acyl CoA:acetate/3-ketoacid CoA transferase alpha subunit
MKTNLLVAIAASGLLLAGTASAQEKKIKRSDLPPAVEKTVAVQSAGATIHGFSTEKEKGQTLYEAEMTVNGHSKDVLIAADGTVVEVEEQVALDSLSPVVKAGLQAKAGKGKIVKVESLTKKDKLVAYEAQVDTNGKKSEVQVGPDGKPLDHEE